MALDNIPSMTLHIGDGGLITVVDERPITDSVLIIGNAVDGPTDRPVSVNSRTVESLFGPLIFNDSYAPSSDKPYLKGKFNGNTLVKAFYEIAAGGCADIYLYRVGGTAATAYRCTGDTYPTTITTRPASSDLGFTIDAIYPGDVYNDVLLTLTLSSTSSGVADITAAVLDITQAGDTNGTTTYCDARKGATVSYNLITNSKRMMDFFYEVNSDPLNKTIRLYIAGSTSLEDSAISGIAAGLLASLPASAFPLDEEEYYFRLSGGVNGTRLDDYSTTGSKGVSGLYADLLEEDTGAFDMLQSVEADICYLACLYADENVGTALAPESVVKEFAEALHVASVENYPMRGVIGISTLGGSYTRAAVSARVGELIVSADNGVLLNSAGKVKLGTYTSQSAGDTTLFDGVDEDTGENVDYGRYLQIVAGPDAVLSQAKLGTYLDSPAGLYAGLLPTVAPSRAATNLTLPGLQGLAFDYTRREVNKLAGGQPWDDVTSTSGKGGSYVVLRRNATRDIVINLDNTCAGRESDYANDQVLNVVNTVASGVKSIVSPFFGHGNQTGTIQAMRTQLRNFLNTMSEQGIIAGGEGNGYELAVESSSLDAVIGRVRISLLLRPAMQIKEVLVVINVAPPAGQ
jgi:hypothetical protein